MISENDLKDSKLWIYTKKISRVESRVQQETKNPKPLELEILLALKMGRRNSRSQGFGFCVWCFGLGMG